jgi:hypothetical protein
MTAVAAVAQVNGNEENATEQGRRIDVRAWITPAIVALVVGFVVSWATRPYLVGVFHDDGIYALLARSIASGEGFHYANLPGAPAATHYPPLYPLILAALWRTSTSLAANIGTLLELNVVLAAAQAVGLWFFATRRLGWSSRGAGVVAVLSSIALPSLALAGALLSETLFLALLWVVLSHCERVYVREVSWREAALAGVSVGLLMLVRTHAIALLFAFVCLMAMRKRFMLAAVAFASCVLVQLPWLIWTSVASPRVPAPLEGSYGSYLGWLAQGVREGGVPFVAATAATNLRETALYIGDRFAAGFPAPLHWLVMGIVCITLLAGVAHLRAHAPVTLLFIVAYFAIVMIWPYTPWRFLWALWPVLVLTGFSGARLLWQKSERWKVLTAVALALPAIAMARVELHSYAARAWRTPASAAAQQIIPALAWTETHASPADVVLSEGDAAIGLQLGRLAAPPISFTAREYIQPPDVQEGASRLRKMLAAVPAQWVVLVNPTTIRSADLLTNEHPGLVRADEFRGGAAFRVVP